MKKNHDYIVTEALINALSPGARAIDIIQLTGGVSAETFALTLEKQDGTKKRFVVRHRPLAKAYGGLSTTAEYGLLRALYESGFAVPRPCLQWPAETMVMEWVDGSSELPEQGPELMAHWLAKIHALGGLAREGLPPREDPLAYLEPSLAKTFGGLRAVDRLRKLMASAPRESCLIHGDFWPGNLLWKNGELVAVLDWEDAALGDPLSDLATARAELTVAAGTESATAFTDAYLSETGRTQTHLPIWDLFVSEAALMSMDSWGLAREVLEHRRRATRTFRDCAIEAVRRLI